MSKRIKLTQGYSAIVDDADYKWLNQWKWQALLDKRHDPPVISVARSGYVGKVNGKLKYKTIKMSRFILDLKPGDGIEADHKNHNALDHRRENLRIATRMENLRNRRRFKNGKTAYKGVSWNKAGKAWQFMIRVGGFKTPKEAAIEYDKYLKILYGEFAVTNF
jgi:hypothetical protein